MNKLAYPQFRNGLVGAWCPSIDRSRSTMLTDFSGYGNHGTLTNMDPGTDWVARDGKIALSCTPPYDFISIGGLAEKVGLVGSTKATLAGWVYRASSGSKQTFGWGTESATSKRAIIQWYSDNIIYVPFENAGVSYPSFASNTTGWHHLAVKFDGSLTGNARVDLFVNGVSRSLTSGAGAPAATIAAGMGDFLVNYDTVSGFGTGIYDDIRLYNRALTPSEISTLAQRRGIAYETYRVPIVRGASGGGDTFTGTASLTLGGLEFSGAGTAQTPTYEATASLALGGLEFSGTASVDNPTYEATAALTLGGVEFAGAASATVNTFTATAALNLGRLDFAGSASFTAPEYTATASLSLAGIDFAGSAAFSTALRTATVEVEIGGMQFTGSATFQTPVMEASAALVLGGVEFAGADVVLGDTTIFLYYYQMMGVQE